MKYTYSPQKGKPGHCMVAQVWDENGDSIAIIEPTKLQKDATQTARQFSKTPEMIELIKIQLRANKLIIKLSNDPAIIHHTKARNTYIESLLKEIKL